MKTKNLKYLYLFSIKFNELVCIYNKFGKKKLQKHTKRKKKKKVNVYYLEETRRNF